MSIRLLVSKQNLQPLTPHSDSAESNRRLLQTLAGHSNTVHSVAFSPNGKLLASQDGTIKQFALELQAAVDAGEAQAKKLNKTKASVFDKASDNGSFNEIIGSHSLMSKDTLESSPFFDDAKVLASVASQCVFRIMLEEVSAPVPGDGLFWQKILHRLIRYPTASGGWEREAMAQFRPRKIIPKYDDLPELVQLRTARLSTVNLQLWRSGKKATELEAEYIKKEKEVSKYRYPA